MQVTKYISHRSNRLYALLVTFVLGLSIVNCYVSSQRLLYGATLFAVIGLLLVYMASTKRVVVSKVHWLWLITVFPVFINNYSIRIGDIGVSTRYVLILLFSIAMTTGIEKYHGRIFRFYYVAGFVFAAATLLFYVIPSWQIPVLSILLPNAHYDHIVDFRQGMTPHYSYNTMVMSCALGAIFALRMSNVKFFFNGGYLKWISFCVAAMAISGKRSIPVFAIFSVLVVLYLIYKNQSFNKKVKFVFGLVFAAVAFFVAIRLNPTLFGIDRMMNDGEEGINMNGRDLLFEYAILLWTQHFWTGIGWGGYKYEVLRANLLGNELALDTHNVWLNLLCETGVIGFTIFTTAILASVIQVGRLFLDINKGKYTYTRQEYALICFSLFMQIFFIIYCFSGNPLYDVPTLYPYMFAIGVVQHFKLKHKKAS